MHHFTANYKQNLTKDLFVETNPEEQQKVQS